MSEHAEPLVNILMGSKSDWGTMQHTRDMLEEFGIANECRVLSAHRTPAEAPAYVGGAEERGVEVRRTDVIEASLLGARLQIEAG